MNKKCKETQHDEKGEEYAKKKEPSVTASVSMHSEGTGHDGDAKYNQLTLKLRRGCHILDLLTRPLAETLIDCFL